MYTLEEMKRKREELAKRYREAKKNGDEQMTKLIEIQGKAIRNAIDKEQIKRSLF
jgi:predicted HAD superfamily Cof-like phosphohydrolase